MRKKIINISFSTEDDKLIFYSESLETSAVITRVQDLKGGLDVIHEFEGQLKDIYIESQFKKFLSKVKRCNLTSTKYKDKILQIYVSNVDLMKNYIEDHIKDFAESIGLKYEFKLNKLEDECDYTLSFSDNTEKFKYAFTILKGAKS